MLGLHPWEFWEYTFEDYMLRRKGFYDNRDIKLRADYQHFRLVAYFCVFPHLTKAGQKKPYTEIIPDIYTKNLQSRKTLSSGSKREEKMRKPGKTNLNTQN